MSRQREHSHVVVPFLDVKATYDELNEQLDAAVNRVMESGRYLLGPELGAFEEEFGRYAGARHCIGVKNGMDALILGLKALGVGPGDEVIVPSNTYIATWLAVSQVGAIPIPVEPNEATYNIDAGGVEASLSARTRCILPVHLYGQPAEMAPILEIARDHNLQVLADAAQSHGARYRGRSIGALGDAVAWSFYPSKNLGAFGDGGAVTTNRRDVADRMRSLRNYGSTTRGHNDEIGYNSRLDELQSACLRVKLDYLDAWNRRRQAIAALYLQELADCGVCLPVTAPDCEHVWHLFPIRSSNRDRLMRQLALRGIMTQVHYPVPPHFQPAYAGRGWSSGSFPISERIHKEVLSLPIGPQLSSDSALQVARAVVEIES